MAPILVDFTGIGAAKSPPRSARALGGDEPELKATIEEFREEELEHRDTALAHEAERAPGYELLSVTIKAGSRLAIWLSERI